MIHKVPQLVILVSSDVYGKTLNEPIICKQNQPRKLNKILEKSLIVTTWPIDMELQNEIKNENQSNNENTTIHKFDPK